MWGWDIEHGPFTAPAAETLARQAATLDLLLAGGRIEGWVTLVGHDLAAGRAARRRRRPRPRARRAMTMHASPTSNDPAAYLARAGVRPIVHFDHLGVSWAAP